MRKMYSDQKQKQYGNRIPYEESQQYPREYRTPSREHHTQPQRSIDSRDRDRPVMREMRDGYREPREQ